MRNEAIRRLYAARGKISPVRVILLGFAGIILVGALLLMLPWATVDQRGADFMTAFFTATSATCVTGLVVAETGIFWSAFGKTVIICLIQLGGLGFMTVFSVLFLLMKKRMDLRGRMVIVQSLSLNDFHDAAKLARHAVYWTLSMEGIGAILLTLGFLRRFSLWKALRYGVFHAISAFCNAGFDLLADTATGGSMTYYATDPAICVPLMLLIVFGGLGFFVWDDLLRSRSWRRLSVYSRLVLLFSGLLLLFGAGLFLLLEWNNPATMGEFSVGGKILAAMFQSATVRTAGFAAIPQGNLKGASLAASDLLMLIGGSSGSTAGGVKTITFLVAVLGAWSTARGRAELTVFRRTISKEQISQATCIVLLMTALAFVGTIFLSFVDGVDVSAAAFEVFSAIATVGLSTGITADLCIASRLLLILYMFFGRVGILTISFAFLTGRSKNRIKYAQEKILIG